MFLCFLIAIFTTVLPDSTNIEVRIEKQVKEYISGISSQESDLSKWALFEISSSDCKSVDKVLQYLGKAEEKEKYTNLKCKTSTRQDAFDNHFEQFWSKEDHNLLNKIVKNDTLINEDILSLSDKPHIHLTLLMRRGFDRYYTKTFLKSALQKWIDLEKKIKDKSSLKHTLYVADIIWVSFILDEYQTVKDYAEDFLEKKNFPVSIKLLRIFDALDYSFYPTLEYDRSLKLQREYSIPLAKYLEDNERIRRLKIRQGVYLYALGKYEESKNIYEELYAQTGIDDFYLFTNLGISYYRLGYSNKYISFQLRALEHDFANYKNLLSVYRNLFLYYTANKDVKSALQYIGKAKEVAIENQDSTELALIDSFLGTFYWSQYEDHQKALDNFTSAQQILDPNQNYTNYINLIFEKGDVLYRIDSLKKAREIFETGKQLALSKSNTVDYLDALINLTAIELKEGDLAAAGKILDEINLYSLEDLDFPLLTKSFTIKSRFLSLTGNSREAIDNLKPVVDQVIDRAKNNTDSQEGYWSVEEEYLDAVQLLVELLIANDNLYEAVTLLDQLKTINDASLYNSPLVKASKLSEENLSEEKRLNQRLQVLRKRYLNADQDSRFEIKKEIDRVSALREQILSEADLNKSTPLSPIWAIQRSIGNNELVLHFTEVGSTLYITYLTENEVKIDPLTFSPEQKEHFGKVADALASGATNLDALFSLYKQLGLDEIPQDVEQITVIPDNFLYRIPLEVLPTKKPDSPISFGSTKYLIEDHHFRYFTSLKEFEDNRRRISSIDKTDFDFSGFAISDFRNFDGVNLPSLPYATVETENIEKALSSMDDKVVYTGQNATKEAFKNRVGNSRLVHVATHSEVSEQDPLFSTIFLSTDNSSIQQTDSALQSEQALYAYELFDTPLNSEFIMLNSCSSGSGNYIQGSGIMGISRALRYAGAKSLALNLWAVNDKIASEFATDFYYHLNRGESKNDAIRKAKLKQLRTGNANPHFWGAYTMIGNPTPITRSRNNLNWFLGIMAIGTIMVGYLAYTGSKTN